MGDAPVMQIVMREIGRRGAGLAPGAMADCAESLQEQPHAVKEFIHKPDEAGGP